MTRLEVRYNMFLIRKGPRTKGASRAVCGFGVPPCDCLNFDGVFNNMFRPRDGARAPSSSDFVYT